MVHGQLHKWLTTALCVLLTAASSAALNYTDTINCTDSNGGMNVTKTEALRHGQCIAYTGGNPCDVFYVVNEDRIFLPFGRARNSIVALNLFAAQAEIIVEGVPQPCRDVAQRLLCYHYYPPCGNSTHFLPPNSLCMDTCKYVSETLCPDQWVRVLDFLKLPGISDNVERYNLPFINCTDPGAALNQLPHCCSDAGIEILQDSTTSTMQILTASQSVSDPRGPNLTAIIPSSVIAAIVVLLVLILITLIVTIVCVKRSTAKVILQVAGDNIDLGDQPAKAPSLKGRSTLPPLLSITTDHGTPPATPTPRYIANTPSSPDNQSLSPTTPGMQPHRTRVASTYIRQMDNEKLVIPGRHISLLDCIGRGEFGVVYRGHLTGWEGRTTPELVAVKTLKSMFSMKEIEDIMEESLKMKSFDHPNVLNLMGVCIDAGEAPYLVMPYMATGSLLNYLRKERPNLTIAAEASEDVAIVAKKKLLSICLQISKGMEYLASKKFVHRDLAARNCMIDSGFVIKVADFGLSEDIYARNYFKQGKLKDDSDVKLPIRWMAIESLTDGIFTEKTDVWSYGVTCWEVFSLGRTPYPGVDPFTLIKHLEGGGRLDKPSNAACSDDVYDVMMRCWNHVPDDRPSFGELVVSLNILLEEVAGYLDFSALSRANGGQAGGREGYDHLPKRDTDDGRYDHLMENMDGRTSPSISPD